MEFTYLKGKILYPNKEITALDKIVADFLSRIDSDYAIVSGYVVILFGRSRNTEDIDMLIRKMPYSRFFRFYRRITESGKYYCVNAETPKDAYDTLNENSSIRFAEKNTIFPNFEIKFPQNRLHLYSLNNATTVVLDNKYKIRIGPIELQIAYKLRLGSEKDYDDAAYLYTVFKDRIDRRKLKKFLKQLDIKTSIAKKILGETYGG